MMRLEKSLAVLCAWAVAFASQAVSLDSRGFPIDENVTPPIAAANIQKTAAAATVQRYSATSSASVDPDQPAAKVLLWQPAGTIRHTATSYAAVLQEAYANQMKKSFTEKYPSGVSVDEAIVANLPDSLDAYALVFVFFPGSTVSSSDVAKLKTVVARGGRVVLQGEHGGFSAFENGILTQLAKDMGADFEITSGILGGGSTADIDVDVYNLESDLLKEPLKDGLYPKSVAVAPIRFSGFAQEVCRIYFETPSNYAVWAVDEVSGKGRITAFSDVNWYSQGDSYDQPKTGCIPFLERLLSNAIANEKAVIDETHTNDVEIVVPSGMVAAVRDNNKYLTFYSTIAAACAAAADNDYDVLLVSASHYEKFTLPVGVTFITTGYSTNYEAYVSAPSGYGVLMNETRDVFKVAGIPSAPVVTASDGSYTGYVHIAWTMPTNNATAYKLRIVNVNTGYEKELAEELTVCEYDDKSAKPGVHYTYYVSAKNAAGWGFEGSDEGWRSVSASVGVANVTARQRYPWSGKVDVDFEVTGDAEVSYRIGLTVEDVAGGTNLPVKTVLGETLVSPGRHRLVWDADADIAADGELPRLKVSVSAVEELK